MSEVMKNTDPYAYWRLALSGERLPIVEDEPQSGFYRRKNRSGKYVPVAIWHDADGLHVLEDGEVVGDNRSLEVWSWCAKSPIEQSTYDAMLGQTSSANDPVYSEIQSDAEALLARVIAITSMPTRIETEADAMRLTDALHVLRKIESLADDQRKQMEQPHKAMIAEIGGIWKEPAAMAKATQDAIKAALLCRINATGKNVKGQLGKAISKRTRKVRVVKDHQAALDWLVKDDPDAFDFAVAKMVKNAGPDVEIPGTEVETVESVQ